MIEQELGNSLEGVIKQRDNARALLAKQDARVNRLSECIAELQAQLAEAKARTEKAETLNGRLIDEQSGTVF